MNFEYSKETRDLIRRVGAFMDEHIYPLESEYEAYWHEAEDPWAPHPVMAGLKEQAKSAGLWNLFLPDPQLGAGLSNLEYAPLSELFGRVLWSAEVFNCNAPDTGNMEVLAQYGTEAQKEQWLKPLLDGTIRSAFSMTEPDVASSDATNISTSIKLDGDEYVINGHKWWSSGAMNSQCKLLIVMGKTNPDGDRHKQQSMILVPRDTPGVEIVRSTSAYGYHDYPFGHAEIRFENVRVPAGNLLLGEGRGFEIAQGRLGPGRIHHCMRLIGCAQRALELACKRVAKRKAFGHTLASNQSVRENIARSYCEIEQARLLTLKAAAQMDQVGNKKAKELIAAIKVVAPGMACRVIDRVIQMHGAAGVCSDHFLAAAQVYARTIRLADGPDEVHMMQLGKWLINDYA